MAFKVNRDRNHSRNSSYNAEKEECVKRDIQKKDVDIDKLLKNFTDSLDQSCHEVPYEQ